MSARRAKAAPEFEAEIIPGLEAYACDELLSRFGAKLNRIRKARAGFLRFRFSGGPVELRALRSVVAIYQIHHFAIPRPKALLGHQHFARLKAILCEASRSYNQPARSLGIGAAGSGSSVMRRLRHELARALRVDAAADDKGELFVRIMPDRRASGLGSLGSHNAATAFRAGISAGKHAGLAQRDGRLRDDTGWSASSQAQDRQSVQRRLHHRN